MCTDECMARLTPVFKTPCSGRVHSAFERVVNIMLHTMTAQRMLTLTAPGLPKLPDSVVVPTEALDNMCLGEAAFLTQEELQVGNQRFILKSDSEWTGFLGRLDGCADSERLLALSKSHIGGFSRLPTALAKDAARALCTSDAAKYIGLGPGLTPAYDDALIGVLAVCRAQNMPAPCKNIPTENTTDVSARYLRLAQEGFFGQPVIDMMRALHGDGSFSQAAEALLNVGATSGKDMLFGMAEACIRLVALKQKEK